MDRWLWTPLGEALATVYIAALEWKGRTRND